MEIREAEARIVKAKADIAETDSITVSYDGRSVTAEFTATLVNGKTITSNVLL